jgi:hypothetical protein
MTTAPATVPLTIPQRGTLEHEIRLLFDCTGAEVYASVWNNEKRGTLLLPLTVTWIVRAETGWDPDDANRVRGRLTISATWEQTRAVTKDGYWDLLWVPATGERNFLMEGPAVLNRNVTEAAA